MGVSIFPAPSTSSAPILQRTLSSTGTVSDLPTGKEITAFIIGGGSGGTGAPSPGGAASGGGKGGGSGSIQQYVFTLGSSRTISYTIAAGGAGGSTTDTTGSGYGGTTTFDSISAHGGIPAYVSSGGCAGIGGGGGGGGGGNSNGAGGNGGIYGQNGKDGQRSGSYSGPGGPGRSYDLRSDAPDEWMFISQSTGGTTYSSNTGVSCILQFEDTINLGVRLNTTGAGSYIYSQGSDVLTSIGRVHAKITSPWTTLLSSTQNFSLDYDTNFGGIGGNGWFQWNRSPYSNLTRLHWLTQAGITLPGGGGGGSSGSGTPGVGAGTGGNGGKYSDSTYSTAGIAPGGGGGGAWGTSLNGGSGNVSGSAGGAGRIYLFWAS